jgi:muramidase (phage lysozyme)
MLAEATNATSNRADVLAALKQASAATGTDFNYLLDTATRESGLKSTAKAGTSSASGLFQFVEQTWYGMVKQHGSQYGLGSYASQISQSSDGRYHVADASDRSAILSLRNDPKVASLMEGEYANQCRTTLQSDLGRNVCNGELYAAHFLGTDAAAKLIRMSENQPNANAAAAFPAAADANQNVFYHADGSPKTAKEVYDWALKQPSGAKAATGNDAAPAPSSSKGYQVYNGGGSDYDTTQWSAFQLLDSMGDGDSFSTASGLPQAPFALTSNIIDMLAQMSPDKAAKHYN